MTRIRDVTWQDKAGIITESVNTGILPPNHVASTASLQPPSRTGKTGSCKETGRPSQTRDKTESCAKMAENPKRRVS